MVDICGCEDPPVTLLRHGLWAGSPTDPDTAFTLGFMETARMNLLENQVSMEGHCRLYEFRFERHPHTDKKVRYIINY